MLEAIYISACTVAVAVLVVLVFNYPVLAPVIVSVAVGSWFLDRLA